MSIQHKNEKKKQKIATELEDIVDEAQELARTLGLDAYPVDYWIVDNTEMNELIAYDGFQTRYPHWRWGMKYTRQATKDQYAGGKAFEIVNNDNPSSAFLQMSNSTSDQKAVITHVEAHADFFKNNRWFPRDPQAADVLARHARKIQSYMDDPEIGREEVEKWIDHVTTITDHIDQYSPLQSANKSSTTENSADERTLDDWLENMKMSEDVKREVFEDEWLEKQDSTADETKPEDDILAFLIAFGKQHDNDDSQAAEYEPWQREILSMLRTEAYYFAPQRMTKTMNEGWASIWESVMMTDESFAADNEIITYADHMSKVLNSPGFNPYKLGKALWEYIENKENRKEVVQNLLRIDGITAKNFHKEIDFEYVLNELDYDSSYDPAKRHYSLTRPQNKQFLKSISKKELNEISRYMFETDRYESTDEALNDIDMQAGWKRIFEVRETHNDITFIEEFLTQEFVQSENYFAYEYNHKNDRMEVSSTDVKDVKQKLLLQTTNFGKPTIVAAEKNYRNRGELLLEHQYNGVMLDIAQVEKTLEQIYELWGRPVNLKTIIKVSPDGEKEEEGKVFRYDGDDHQERDVKWTEVEHLSADKVDYNTKPDEWT